MSNLLITGATGYIGDRLVEMALAAGHSVTVLGRRPSARPVRNVPWDLDRPVPDDAFAGVDAVIHLAHQWQKGDEPEGEDANTTGTRALLDAARRHGVARFVFGSTIVARPDALNKYGRNKALTEGLLQRPGEVAARIGLVYGGALQALWGTMCRVAGLGPVLPMLGVDQPVQPIHRDEVCEGLLRLATLPTLSQTVYVLAGSQPMTFGAFLKLIARQRLGRRLWLLPIPLKLALAAVDLLALVPGLPKVGRERVLGLAGMRTLASAADLAAIGLTLRSPAEALKAERPV
ncbi:MAG: NAD-dependent epimerase/dehydratase family protein [Actinomycetota bacterium]